MLLKYVVDGLGVHLFLISRRTDIAYHQLNGIGIVRSFSLFYGVAYVNRLVRMDMLEILRHIEGDRIYHMAGAVVFKFQLDMLHIFAHELTGAEIKHVA